MGLVTAKEVAKAINADKYGVFGTFSGWLLMKVLKISTLNKIYDRNFHQNIKLEILKKSKFILIFIIFHKKNPLFLTKIPVPRDAFSKCVKVSMSEVG